MCLYIFFSFIRYMVTYSTHLSTAHGTDNGNGLELKMTWKLVHGTSRHWRKKFALQINKFKLDIIGISKVKKKGNGKMSLLDEYKLLYSGVPKKICSMRPNVEYRKSLFHPSLETNRKLFCPREETKNHSTHMQRTLDRWRED